MGLEFLLHGYDTIQCAYYLRPLDQRRVGISFEELGVQREAIRASKQRGPKALVLGDTEFHLQPYGTASRYPFVLTNRDFLIACGEFNNPSFFVTFRSEALWQVGAEALHRKFLSWAQSVGYTPFRTESLARVDFSFDYHLPRLDFDEDCFISLSHKDSQHREHGQIQTFTYGKSDIVLRVYDKIAEIEQQSGKTWFFDLWGRDDKVWRIEWQVRKATLKRFSIETLTDLSDNSGDLLRYLAQEHDTLRVPSPDTNRSRWPLHPLWADIQDRVASLKGVGIYRVIDEEARLREQLVRLGIISLGYLKRIGAIRCVQTGCSNISVQETLATFSQLINTLHDPLNWRLDIAKRIEDIRLTHG
jgi:hypothetical protein